MNRKTKAACDFFLGIFLSVIFASGSAAYEEIAVNNGATIRGSVKGLGQAAKAPALADYQVQGSLQECAQ